MPQQHKTSDSPKPSSTVQVAIAIIGALAILGAALVANWDKLTSRRASNTVSPAAGGAAATATPPSLLANTQGPQSPVVSGVGGNVTITVGTSDSTSSPFEGYWEARVADLGNEYLSGFDIHVSGTVVSGFAYFKGQESTLRDGKISGQELQFTTHGTGPNGEAEIRRYRGILERDDVRFTLDIEAPASKHRTLNFTAMR